MSSLLALLLVGLGLPLVMCGVRVEAASSPPMMQAQTSEGALQWFGEAAKQGDAEAQTALGSCYHYGEGVARSVDMAAEWYAKAAAQGYAEAQCHLAASCYNGDGVT